MSAPIPIPLKLTNAGRLAALDASNSGLNIKLTHFAIGSGQYNSETTGAGRTALQNEIARYPVSGGSIEPVSRTLRFSAILESGITQNAFEVGLFDENGVLFAVASTTGNDPLILVTANIAFVASLSLVLADINVTNLSVVDDPSSPLAIALMNQHLANPDPHPQYPLKAVLASIIYPVGSWHGTNNASYNPATALKPLFGYETTWYLWPYVPAGVANTSTALGQIVEFENGSGTQAKTTRIWERLPDGASAPTYVLTASQDSVNEGEQVTFTLSTTGIAQGTAVDWNITGIQTADITPNALTGQFVVGADGTATYSLTVVEDVVGDENETLKFALTYISNKFVNVIISDTTLVEQVVTINSNQTDINLLQLFTSQYGTPTNKTRAVFNVQENVNIIASSTLMSAVYSDHWPTGSTREIRQYAGSHILGRGGDGGSAVDYGDSVAAKSGKDGGTAVFAENDSPITIHNYDALIAGGGAGGGASPSLGNSEQEWGLIAPGSGGAPFGAAGTLAKNSKAQPSHRMRYYVNGTMYRWQYSPADSSWYRVIGDNTSGNTTTFTTPQKIFDDSGLLAPVPTFELVAYESNPEFAHQGGNGGGPGENGSAGTSRPDGNGFEVLTPSGNGGLAGYIYQGPVTIINHGSGQSKGRTP